MSKGLVVSSNQYSVVLNLVLMGCLLEDLAIMHGQKPTEADHSFRNAETVEERTRLAKEPHPRTGGNLGGVRLATDPS